MQGKILPPTIDCEVNDLSPSSGYSNNNNVEITGRMSTENNIHSNTGVKRSTNTSSHNTSSRKQKQTRYSDTPVNAQSSSKSISSGLNLYLSQLIASTFNLTEVQHEEVTYWKTWLTDFETGNFSQERKVFLPALQQKIYEHNEILVEDDGDERKVVSKYIVEWFHKKNESLRKQESREKIRRNVLPSGHKPGGARKALFNITHVIANTNRVSNNNKKNNITNASNELDTENRPNSSCISQSNSSSNSNRSSNSGQITIQCVSDVSEVIR
jgi:hypothetical protein